VRPLWRWALGAVLLAAALGNAARFPWADTWAALASADWGLLAAAAGANLLSLACKACGWHLLLRPIASVRARTTQVATFAGAAVGSFSVALSGEAVRLHLLAERDSVEPPVAARTIAASRLVEAVALGIFVGAFAVSESRGPGWWLAAGAAVLTATGWALLRWLPWLRWRLSDGSRDRGFTLGRALAPVSFGVAAWTLQWATYHWSIAATHIAVSRSGSMRALLLSNLGGLLRLTPGNVGIVQGAVVMGLAPARVPAAHAVAAGLALQAVEVLPVMVVGMAILGRRGIRLRVGGSPKELESTT
jgi:uncharacterized membrane protein YbhN (UPF0104 family)